MHPTTCSARLFVHTVNCPADRDGHPERGASKDLSRFAEPATTGLGRRITISECLALLPEDSTATIDSDFANDVQAAVERHREALNSHSRD